MNKEKDFFKTCFNIVAGLEVRNESQTIAKEVVLSEIERLQQENRKQKEIIDETINAIDLVIELVKQQPTEDDRWILDRLNGFKIILEDKEVSDE
jgi:hypothetical protein